MCSTTRTGEHRPTTAVSSAHGPRIPCPTTAVSSAHSPRALCPTVAISSAHSPRVPYPTTAVSSAHGPSVPHPTTAISSAHGPRALCPTMAISSAHGPRVLCPTVGQLSPRSQGPLPNYVHQLSPMVPGAALLLEGPCSFLALQGLPTHSTGLAPCFQSSWVFLFFLVFLLHNFRGDLHKTIQLPSPVHMVPYLMTSILGGVSLAFSGSFCEHITF